MKPFQIGRADGRSNATVLLDYVRPGEPGRIYSYDELAAALSEGAPRAYDREAVRGIVQTAYTRLLKEQQRTLINVRGMGYRLSHANDHRGIALVRTRKADQQMRRGVQALTHVRWDEMDAQTRQAHEGTLMILGTMYQQQQAMDRRLHAVEQAIRDLKTQS